MERYAKPTKEAHGTKGPIGVGYGSEWMPLIDTYLEAANDALNCGIIPDYNDGNVVGASVAQFNIAGGERITSPDAYLKQIPGNLTLWTEVDVNRIIMEGKKAVGVEFIKDGKTGLSKVFISNVRHGKMQRRDYCVLWNYRISCSVIAVRNHNQRQSRNRPESDRPSYSFARV
jgi:choline dehydrogenase-like flavoprotein